MIIPVKGVQWSVVKRHPALRRPVKPTEASALECLLNDGINDGKIAGQFLRDGVTISQVGHTGRTHPDLLIRTLPDEDFEGQIKCQQRGRNHEWCATFRIAKDQHIGLLHREADAFRFTLHMVCIFSVFFRTLIPKIPTPTARTAMTATSHPGACKSSALTITNPSKREMRTKPT